MSAGPVRVFSSTVDLQSGAQVPSSIIYLFLLDLCVVVVFVLLSPAKCQVAVFGRLSDRAYSVAGGC